MFTYAFNSADCPLNNLCYSVGCAVRNEIYLKQFKSKEIATNLTTFSLRFSIISGLSRPVPVKIDLILKFSLKRREFGDDFPYLQ